MRGTKNEAGETREMTIARGIYGHTDLRRLLHPSSVAIVGASQRPGAFGERVMANLAGKYGGRVYLVNARYEEINGHKCYPSLSALPDVPDCVMICVAREQVEPVVEECVAIKAGGAIVFASGYAEVEKPGRAEQQARLGEIARKARMPLIGPNCIGVNNYALQARITFMPPDDIGKPGPGAIGIVSQSGAIGFGLEHRQRHGRLAFCRRRQLHPHQAVGLLHAKGCHAVLGGWHKGGHGRHLHALATTGKLPAVVGALQLAILHAAQRQAGTAVRAAVDKGLHLA
jgi:predicted CoA-binding protein